MNKPRPPRALADLTGAVFADAFKQQGFASAELVTRWADIAGAEVAALAEPLRIQWPRALEGVASEPATLVLRVEGPAAIEVQHLSNVILERVHRFFGWQAVGRLAPRQAPLARRAAAPRRRIDPDEAERAAAAIPAVEDDALRHALGRLAAAVKRT